MSSGLYVEAYNGTSGVADTGGDSLTEDLNVYYEVSFQGRFRRSTSLVMRRTYGDRRRLGEAIRSSCRA